MRFDAAEYVETWRTAGTFPRIHSAVVSMVRQEIDPREGTVLDLGSSTGLLARQLDGLGYRTVAVQEPGSALELGEATGVYEHTPVLFVKVTPDTLPRLLDFVEDFAVTTIVARRVFPELWDALGPEHFPELVTGLRARGVRTIVLEGRLVSARTTHPLGSAELERKALDVAFVRRAQVGPVIAMEAKPWPG